MLNQISAPQPKPFALSVRFRRNTSGLTILELLIVVGIILVLAGIAIPSIMRGRQQAQIVALGDEFRLDYEAFVLYAQEKGQLPETAVGLSEMPPGMSMYLPKRTTWLIDNSTGSLTSPQFRGRWYWLKSSLVPTMDGYNGFIMFYSPDLTSESAQQVDARLDDGDINTGALRFADGSGDASGKWLYFAVQ